MPMPLVATKLYAPPPQAYLTARVALWRRLGQEQRPPFLLVSAPAGFGKTTLVLDWLRRAGQPFAWLSLEAGDDEPTRFWRYAIAALQTVVPGIGVTSQSLLDGPQLPAPETVVAALINDLVTHSKPLTLVLDDYHWIQSAAIQAGLNYLLDHQPRQLSLVITTREDPPLGLARRRARRELVEIRAADLRFSRDEAASFLNGPMALGLADDDIAALDERTEGWIAGLQMVALSLAGRADKHAFVRSFAGDDRYIADYLMEEVLGRQPPAVQDFLLRTSILERFNGALCDALLGRGDSGALIHAIEDSNLFVAPLDNRREWYRYHHLFGELLRQRLLVTAGAAAVTALHRRASAWYADQQRAPEAIEHALKGQDYDQAASLVEAAGGMLFLHNDLPTLVGWWQAIPAAVRANYPFLNMMSAWALLATGHPDEALASAEAVEAALSAPGSTAAGRLRPDQARGAAVEVAVLHLSVAFSQENGELGLALARQIEPQLADGQIESLGPGLFNGPDNLRPVVRYGLAIGLEQDGQLNAAGQAYAQAEALARPRQNVHILALAASRLAQLQVIQGNLREAGAACQRTLRPAGDEASSPSPLLGITHGVLGLIHYERDELDAALTHLETGARLAAMWANAEGLLPSRVGLARVQLARGDLEAALATADDLVRVLRQYNAAAFLAQGEGERARLYAEAGRHQPALDWAEAGDLDTERPWRPAREPEAIALARVWLCCGRPADAHRLATRLTAETEAGQRWGRLAEILAIRALAAQAVGQAAEAGDMLGRALALAAPEGRVRLFVDLGEPMLQLLSSRPAGAGEPGAFLERLLAAFPSTRAAAPAGRSAGLAEPLTEREMEVLRLIEAGLTNQAIAERLVISLGTVKSHTANLFGKLGVSSRTQAAAKARALGLLLADPTNPAR